MGQPTEGALLVAAMKVRILNTVIKGVLSKQLKYLANEGRYTVLTILSDETIKNSLKQ